MGALASPFMVSQRFIQAQIKEKSKLRVTGLCEGNSPGRWPVTRKMFPFDYVIMPITAGTRWWHCKFLNIFSKWYFCHVIAMGYDPPQNMQLENINLIWTIHYGLRLRWKCKLCSELTWSKVAPYLMLLNRIMEFLVECICGTTVVAAWCVLIMDVSGFDSNNSNRNLLKFSESCYRIYSYYEWHMERSWSPQIKKQRITFHIL